MKVVMRVTYPSNKDEVLEKIIWSADDMDPDTLLATVDRMRDIRIIKIDRLMVRKYGESVIDALQERGIRVFNDAKIVEVPSKTEGLADVELLQHPWMLNCMAGCLSSGVESNEDRDKVDGLKRFADACLEAGTKPCGVTVLTSKKKQIALEEYNCPVDEQVLFYVSRLQRFGFTDVVCSPEEAAAIRSESAFDGLQLNTPGIRPAGSDVGDQARVNTPAAALKTGADRLVIGRPLSIGNPAENLSNIVDGILAAA